MAKKVEIEVQYLQYLMQNQRNPEEEHEQLMNTAIDMLDPSLSPSKTRNERPEFREGGETLPACLIKGTPEYTLLNVSYILLKAFMFKIRL